MKILMIIAQQGFQDQEYSDPRTIFEQNGMQVYTCSLEKGKAVGSHGKEVEAELGLNNVTDDIIGQFGAIVTIGGPGIDSLDVDQYYHIIQTGWERGKIIASICAAPKLLAKMGILNGKKFNAYEGVVKFIENKFGEHVDEPVVVDGKFVTSPGPDAAVAFGNEIVKMLKEQ